MVWQKGGVPFGKSPPSKKAEHTFQMGELDFREKQLPVYDEPVFGMSPPDVCYHLAVHGADIVEPNSMLAVMSSSLGSHWMAAAEELVCSCLLSHVDVL